MLLPIATFVIVAGLLFLLGLLFIRTGRNGEGEILAGGRARRLTFGPLTVPLAGVLPVSAGSKGNISRDLRRAGFYHRLAYEEFMALRNALVVGWVLLVGTAIVAAPEPAPKWMPAAIACAAVLAVLLFAMPVLLLHAQAKARLQRIQYGLPDALDMITMCMEGGLPLPQVLQRVGHDLATTHADLACELKIIGRQMEAGSLDGALRQFAARIDIPDVQSLAALVGQTEQQGGSVAGALAEFADGVRRAQRQRAEEHGNKTSVKLLFPLVLCLAPPVYILLLTPAIIEMREFVLKENRPGGILTPQSLVAESDVLSKPLSSRPTPRRQSSQVTAANSGGESISTSLQPPRPGDTRRRVVDRLD